MISYQNWSVPSGPEKKVGDQKGFYENQDKKLSFMNYNDDINEQFNFMASLLFKNFAFYN